MLRRGQSRSFLLQPVEVNLKPILSLKPYNIILECGQTFVPGFPGGAFRPGVLLSSLAFSASWFIWSEQY